MCSKVTHHSLNARLVTLFFSLITIHISDCRQFSDIHISQGSVETRLKCGGIVKFDFVASLPVSLPVKEF